MRRIKKRLVNIIWELEQILIEWHMSELCPIHKKRRPYGLSELQRNIPIKYIILQNSIKYNIKPNQIIRKWNNRRISVKICVREFDCWSNTYDKVNSRKKSRIRHIYVYLFFVDFRQAYNSINRHRLCKTGESGKGMRATL